jgi:hypothetical protein
VHELNVVKVHVSETAKTQVLTGDDAAIVANKQATADAQMVVRITKRMPRMLITAISCPEEGFFCPVSFHSFKSPSPLSFSPS